MDDKNNNNRFDYWYKKALEKITKSDLMLPSESYDLNEFIDFVPDWDNVIDYYWSVDKRPPRRSLYNSDWRYKEELKEHNQKYTGPMMWSKDYEKAAIAKHESPLSAYLLTLNLKLSDGVIIKTSKNDHGREHEIEMIQELLYYYSQDEMNKHKWRSAKKGAD